MKNMPVLLVLWLLLSQCSLTSSHGISIEGRVKNSNDDFVVLSYTPRYRGNLNFDNFKSKGARTDKNGSFSFHADKITNASNYLLSFKDNGFGLVLFEGDDLQLEFDIEKPHETLFAKGKGAAKINILNLEQFRIRLPFDKNHSVEAFKMYTDSLVNFQSALLKAIYEKQSQATEIVSASNRASIDKIIDENNFSQEEYEFLKKKVATKYFYLNSYISSVARNNPTDTMVVDFNSPLFSHFNIEEYKKIDNLNDWDTENGMEGLLYVEYLKSKYAPKSQFKYNNWNCCRYDSAYRKWISVYLKDNFGKCIFEKYYAEQVVSVMLMGNSMPELNEAFLKFCPDSKYLERINTFKEILKKGLCNPEYNLNHEDCELSAEKLNSLIESNHEKPLYFVFWNAQFCGAEVIPNLPALIDFESYFADDYKIINICIDEAKFKNLWAARIIDNSWKGKHYFLPKEGNDSLIAKFGCERIFSFCYDGVRYSTVGTDGKICNNEASPLLFSKSNCVNRLKSMSN